ncbi:hypothetical protein [Ignatzschineria cameli]|uniref:hypothetical protein n=1 Tax=Ignatzschineria cameli TaxID=2182793 RepID=UPI000D6089B4|nr:hypothetical protein [Ignatzschineria cameli]PWD85350.1 hypothetical protein DC080_06750 [Ignatzschineria cameli]
MSPWIFSELAFTKFVNKESLEYHRETIPKDNYTLDKKLKIVHSKPSLENTWTSQQFNEWLKDIECMNGWECLDHLYNKLKIGRIV